MEKSSHIWIPLAFMSVACLGFGIMIGVVVAGQPCGKAHASNVREGTFVKATDGSISTVSGNCLFIHIRQNDGAEVVIRCDDPSIIQAVRILFKEGDRFTEGSRVQVNFESMGCENGVWILENLDHLKRLPSKTEVKP